jgi:serine/threonine protein kinase
MRFYEFVKYVLHEFYGYQFVKYKNVKHQKSDIPDCLKFESNNFEIYLIIQQKPDGKLSIRNEFSLKLNTFHQGKKHKYFVSRSISKGSYGKVYLCVDEDGNQFAIKLFQFSHEMDIELKALNHLENIDQVITAIDSFNFSLLDIKFGAFVMPFMTYTLKSFVEKYKPSENFILRVFYGLLLNLRKIHEMGCFHMDIKPENILINVYPDGTVDMKLADFGLAEILPEGTNYATTPDPKITDWFRCPMNALAKANGTDFHISWIADFFALCVSMIYMCSRKSGKSFDFLNRSMFNIFRGQQFFKLNCEDDESPKELDIDLSKIRIENACRTAIKNKFFCDILIEYMDLDSIMRWYSELKTCPKDNSVIMEVIQKIEVYLRMTESDSETPPRPHAYVSSP